VNLNTTRQAGVTNTILFLRESILGANNITRDRRRGGNAFHIQHIHTRGSVVVCVHLDKQVSSPPRILVLLQSIYIMLAAQRTVNTAPSYGWNQHPRIRNRDDPLLHPFHIENWRKKYITCLLLRIAQFTYISRI
jgi:hypothetical protein